MSWLDKIKQYAPDIAMAIASGGATLPALAMKAVSDAIPGVEIKTQKQMIAAIDSASPDEMLALQESNNSFTIQMKQLSNDLTATELSDVKDARKQHKHSAMPAAICIVLTMLVAGAGYMLMTTSIPDGNQDIAYMLFGQVTALWGASVTYWVGTTRSSAEKDRR
jgi:hypothetical protein